MTVISHKSVKNDCRSNDCRSNDRRSNDCRSNDCRSNEAVAAVHGAKPLIVIVKNLRILTIFIHLKLTIVSFLLYECRLILLILSTIELNSNNE